MYVSVYGYVQRSSGVYGGWASDPSGARVIGNCEPTETGGESNLCLLEEDILFTL